MTWKIDLSGAPKFRTIAALICVLGAGSPLLTFAQEVLVSPEALRSGGVRYEWPQPASRSTLKDTLTISSSQPFFDDFSSGKQPDSTKWDLETGNLTFRYPTLTRQMAIEPPSLGVATFEGSTAAGIPYRFDFSNGPADRLESHYIDLSAFGPGDNVLLTFFLQPQGLNVRPMQDDFFRVYANPVQDDGTLTQIYEQQGSTLTPFKQISIPITNPDFFHTRFYLAFESEGDLNGLLNAWHLDYVTLGVNRSARDTVYKDVSVLYPTKPAFAPFTALTYQEYRTSTYNQIFDMVVSDLSNDFNSVQFRTSVLDPVGGNPLMGSGYNLLLSPNFPQRRHNTVGPLRYSDTQSLNSPPAACFQLIHQVALTNDARPENDILTEHVRLDSIIAYDDGEADAIYGLTIARGFGMQFELQEPDSIMAVWISFAPLIDYRQGQSLEGKPFRINIWDEPHPDSLLYQQLSGVQIVYGDSTDHFQRYPLSRPISVSETFWVGVSQFDNVPIGVGYDLTNNNNSLVYWDSLGRWINSNLNGTLMIRPEFRNVKFNGPPVIASQEKVTMPDFPDVKVYPNPLTDNTLHLAIKAPVTDHSIRLLDLGGREVFADSQKLYGTQKVTYSLPGMIPGGIYFLHQTYSVNGRVYRQTDKLLIQW
ncbi:MAG: hypothetical protein AAGI38_19515 [Bacteroidota bacterium]